MQNEEWRDETTQCDIKATPEAKQKVESRKQKCAQSQG
jgi:hypothetical protein